MELAIENADVLARTERKRFARDWQRMDPQILIDAIVRQTMVLIARLSTVDGVRSPLSHIANEVFVCGTATEVVHVREIDFRVIGEGGKGPVAAALQEAFFKTVRGEGARSYEWLEYVDETVYAV